MLTEVQIQRIKHLQLQGFSVQQISDMQQVEIREVNFVFKQQQDSIFRCDAPFKDRIKMNNKKSV